MLYDIAIIGGGINGAGLAREAARRGGSVYLCEMNDLASGTSSAATKLIHGGLRYLEYYAFRLVHEALTEREVLWAMAPHIIKPLRFVLPHHKGLRPAWFLRLGLFMYDHMGGRKRLPVTRRVDLVNDGVGAPLKRDQFRFGFEYSDCWVDDARLVVLNARDAADHGATIETRTRAVSAERAGDRWLLTVEDAGNGERRTIEAKVLINAAGPWVAEMLDRITGPRSAARVRLVQGSHIVVRKLYDHDRCYIFQNADGRIIFAIPYEDDFTLIGTTDLDYSGDPAAVKASADEIRYLASAASEYFVKPITPEDVVWSYSGVRPLYDDGASEAKAATRDYVLELDAKGGPALLSVFGGKITTYRRLALHALNKLKAFLPAAVSGSPNDVRPLPGGDFAVGELAAFTDSTRAAYPWLSTRDADRLCRSYGTRVAQILGPAKSAADLGRTFGAGLTEAELVYLIEREWAVTAADVVWRRSKLGLRLTAVEIAEIDRFMAERRQKAVAA
ncbi:MAG: glycerol-3-phosphate dehydrogenase [Ancalomicrobiaceae bacterium]|nr:glycerol-3-phosphate dehydrogenase [Ancalomicrobiaceae bacterium]